MRCQFPLCEKNAEKQIILEGNYGSGDRKAFLCDDHAKEFVDFKYTFNLGRISIYTAEIPYKFIDTFS